MWRRWQCWCNSVVSANLVSAGETLSRELDVSLRLVRGSPWAAPRSLASHSPTAAFSHRDKKAHPSCFSSNLVWLCAEWAEAALAKLDVNAWVNLPEDASCSKEILAGVTSSLVKRSGPPQSICDRACSGHVIIPLEQTLLNYIYITRWFAQDCASRI